MQKYRRYICKQCWSKRQQGYQNADPSRKLKKHERSKIRRAEWSDERKALEARKSYSRKLKKTYGISIEDYDRMLIKQSGMCSICESPMPIGKGKCHIDHCHDTGVIRSLLCSKCNMMLGLAGDSSDLLRKAAEYIEHHKIDHKCHAK